VVYSTIRYIIELYCAALTTAHLRCDAHRVVVAPGTPHRLTQTQHNHEAKDMKKKEIVKVEIGRDFKIRQCDICRYRGVGGW
jgi:hypothetical protein